MKTFSTMNTRRIAHMSFRLLAKALFGFLVLIQIPIALGDEEQSNPNPYIAACPFEFVGIDNAKKTDPEDVERKYLLEKGSETAMIRIKRKERLVTDSSGTWNIYGNAIATLTIEDVAGGKTDYQVLVSDGLEFIKEVSVDPMLEPYTATIHTMQINDNRVRQEYAGDCLAETTFGFECATCECPDDEEPTLESVHYRMFAGRVSQTDRGHFLTYENESMQNQGASILKAHEATGFKVNREGNGKITSQVTDTVETIVSPVSSATDPKAFRIDYKHRTGGVSGAVFKSVVYENIIVSGDPYFRISVTMDQTTRNYDYAERTDPSGEYDKIISLSSAGGLKRETRMKTGFKEGSDRVERIIKEQKKADGSYEVVSDVKDQYVSVPGGERRIRSTIDPLGLALVTEWEYYSPGEESGPSGSTVGWNKLKRMVRYDGQEETYFYGKNRFTTISGYAGQSQAVSTIVERDPKDRIVTTTRRMNGIIMSKSVKMYGDNAVTSRTYTDASNYLQTVTEYMPLRGEGEGQVQEFSRQPKRTTNSDGTVTIYEYSRSGGSKATTTYQGVPGGSNISEGTKTVRITNAQGQVESEITTAVGTGEGITLSHMIVLDSDAYGRPLSIGYFPNGNGGFAYTASKTYSCCGVATETDQYGITTTYAHDDLKRVVKTNRLGVTTATIYDGLAVSTHRYAETAAEAAIPDLEDAVEANLIAKSVRSTSGTVSESWSRSAADGAFIRDSLITNTYLNPESANPASLPAGIGQRQVTQTVDGFTQTSDSYLDGKTYESYGDLSPAMRYAYSVNVTGEVTSRSYVDGSNLRETTTSQSDWAGRTRRITYQDGAFAAMDYNSLGQMVSSTDPDGVTTLMAYNPEGQQVVTAVDLNVNGATDYGTDTVQFSETNPATGSINGVTGPVWKTTSKIWYKDESNQVVEAIVSTALSSPDGLSSSSQSIGVVNPSTSLTTLSGNGNWTQKSTYPDSTYTLTSYVDGRMDITKNFGSGDTLISSTSMRDASNEPLSGYDDLNRPTHQYDSRTGVTATEYLSATSDVVKSVTDPGNRTTAFIYDVRGRRITLNAPDSVDADGAPLFNVTNTAYNPDDTVAEVNGAQTYRTTNTYDYARRMITLTTYGTETATTVWKYSPDRGFLTEKNYHGETDDGQAGADYSYTAAGRLLSRRWERGITTNYGYDKGGRMVSTDYSDTTPDVLVTYDALGRPLTVKNGAGIFVNDIFTIATPLSSSDFIYDTATLAADTETVSHDIDLNGTPELTRVIDRSRDNLNRSSGWQLKTGATVENSVEYQYSPTDGRIETISGGGLLPPSPFNYSFEPNSYGLIKTVTGSIHTVTNFWETNRDVLALKENKVGTTNISSYGYGVNSIGQRTDVAKTGTAFAGALDITWGYNSKGEVTKADHTIPGLDRSYLFDGIGNRLKSADSLTLPATNNYTPNALNQYTAVENIVPVHDADGNASAYPVPAHPGANSMLTWDGENRLISANVNGSITNFRYDAQSRRIAVVSPGGTATLTIYDGWNPIGEYGSAGFQAATLIQSFTWGIDLSGSMQSAGGVGGLLMVTVGSTSSAERYFPTYDGNGNVSEYLDSAGAVQAHYEYDPFGRTTVATGSKANDFAHRFSTKPLDAATGLYYYGYRWYDAPNGRWLSRDPIEEGGGVNLYGFCLNQPTNGIDVNGEVFWVPVLVIAVWLALEQEAHAPTINNPNPGLSAPSLPAAAARLFLAVCVPIDEVGGAVALGGRAIGCCRTVVNKCCCKTIEFVESKALRLSKKQLNAIEHTFGNADHNLDDLLKAFGGDGQAAFRAMAAKARSKIKETCSGDGLKGLGNVRVEIDIKGIKYTVKGWIDRAGDFIPDTGWKN